MKIDPLSWGPIDPDYTLAKLRKALQDFNEHTGPMADRLYEAYFQLHLLTENDFPPPFRPAFRSIIQAMTARPDPVKPNHPERIGDARNTLKHLNETECLRIVDRLTALIAEVEKSVESG